jgi:hypothetical protein
MKKIFDAEGKAAEMMEGPDCSLEFSTGYNRKSFKAGEKVGLRYNAGQFAYTYCSCGVRIELVEVSGTGAWQG